MNVFFQHDYPNFEYEAWGGTRHCFLRVRVFSDGDMVVFCSGAHRDESNDITSNVEVIYRSLVKELIVKESLPGISWPRSSKGQDRLLASVAVRTRFVEHNITRQFGESYSLVILSSGPCWSFMDKKTIAELPGFDNDFITHPLELVQKISSESDVDKHVSLKNEAIDKLFQLLNEASWLPQIRSFGVRIMMDDSARSLLINRHGKAGQAVVDNCMTLDRA